MPAGMGVLSFVGLGKETTWGTGVTANVFFPVLSCEPEESREDIADEGVRGVPGAPPPFAGPQSVEISMQLDLRPYVLCHLLRSLCGPPTSTQPDPTNHPSVWEHHWVFPRSTGFSDMCYPWPYSIEVFRDIATQSKRYVGCGLNTLALTIDVGDKLWRGEAGWIGRGFPGNVEKSTPTIPVVRPWLWSETKVSINGTQYNELRTLSLEFNNELKAEHLIDETAVIRVLSRDGYSTLTLSGTALPFSASEYDAFLTRTPRQLEFGAAGDVISGTYRHLFHMWIPIVYYTSYSVPISGVERLTAEWEAEAYHDATLGGICGITVITTVPGSELA